MSGVWLLRSCLFGGCRRAVCVHLRLCQPTRTTRTTPADTPTTGFSVPQEVPAHSWLRRGVPPPVNRYNLRPGRHWDGVDRSTGFEKQMFKMLNSRNAREAEARMWAQEDM
jgi:hypothetical protein